LKAHVDLESGKIHGCKPGTFKWFHEKGHIEFNKDETKSYLILWRRYIFEIWLFFIMASIVIPKVFFVAVFMWLAYVGIGIYEEWWCNEYAKKILQKNL